LHRVPPMSSPNLAREDAPSRKLGSTGESRLSGWGVMCRGTDSTMLPDTSNGEGARAFHDVMLTDPASLPTIAEHQLSQSFQ